MKKRNCIISLFFLTGCFEITELVKHNKDNSGNYSLVIDFSPSWLKVRTAIALGEVDGVSIPSEEEIKSKLANFRNKASKIKGVSKISSSYDFKITYLK